jgi:hypothetical protein
MVSHVEDAHVLFHTNIPSSHVASASFSGAVAHSGLQRPWLGIESFAEQVPGDAPTADSISTSPDAWQTSCEVVSSDTCGQIPNAISERFTAPDRIVLDPALDCHVSTGESITSLVPSSMLPVLP